MNAHALECAAQALLAAVLAEGQWLPAMEDLTSCMGVLGGGLASITVPTMFALPTSGVRHQFLDFQAGKSPALTRATPLNPTMQSGFVAEHLHISEDIRKRDVFYQEFLRPRDCSHHISALLDCGPAGRVNFLAFRPEREGAFQEDELRTFDRALPFLRAAAVVARGTLNSEARHKAEPFERRGEPVVSLDARGRVMALNSAAEGARGELFDIVGHHIAAVARSDQPRLDRGLKQALEAGRPSLVTLTRFSGDGRVMALIVPIQGQAHDVFRAVSVFVVFIAVGRGATTDSQAPDLLREAAGLTRREWDVVQRIGQGRRPNEIAEALQMSVSTVRVHLRSATGKLGVHSQVELAALIKRLS